jgi:hypothetical protein
VGVLGDGDRVWTLQSRRLRFVVMATLSLTQQQLGQPAAFAALLAASNPSMAVDRTAAPSWHHTGSSRGCWNWQQCWCQAPVETHARRQALRQPSDCARKAAHNEWTGVHQVSLAT